MTIPPGTREPKADRILIRTTARQHQLIRDAAQASGKTVSAFLLDAATLEAQRALADRRTFSLDQAGWRRFVEALERPAQLKPRLRTLLRTPDVE